ncbi:MULTISPECIES: C4-dicarboxylate TRAP transporter substrate-binding protein [unclassified Chelatococcus]|jgi:tripartite ATP-independent transporter DctP family solute receptor|uniref:C4-dicarboxylate TRAP transporter substrate-binding protein n=1 Tax=unclassified Chelatococcus TaxID=2638111 RepID=UPI0020BEF006|nr:MULTISPECIES: C4-dicarboxylate TRAP transporter substrate-binding protein [unclassified Chelatococcus]MCO5076958.1 C4-dicarboxylate TRAP transporter substrate-binding protein [Chelatococcus sp.]CAH1671819.1 Tripartite ATP-independent transporter DctP family solute receptor [Hyphomicrobiales bacterium]CAH1675967.1 Tripartite ATP-independent transporter DctP family solute receptor [Hyphomicrobiales bacterium]
MSIKALLSAVGISVALIGAAAAQDYKLRFATSVANTEEASYKEMQALAARVKERSKGKLELQLFPAEQLGAQKKVNEMISSGANIMNMTDYGQLGQFVPDAGVLAGPYIFGSLNEAEKLFASPVFREVSDKLEQKGMKIIMANGLFGARHMLSEKPIRKPDDLKGLTVRVPPSPIMVETFKDFGARPTEIPWGEVYNALQSNVVNAAEAPFGAIWGSKLQEVRKVVSKTNHQLMFTAWVTSTSFFNKLPPELQTILIEEGKVSARNLTKATLEQDDQFAKMLEKAGVTLVTDIDVAAFQKASAGVYEKLPNLTPGFVAKARAAMAN